MKSSHWSLLLLAVGLVVGMLVGADKLQRGAEAQVVPLNPAPRFQISAWGMGYPQPPGNVPNSGIGRGERGCYIVDTASGELWHAAADGQPKKISEKLR